VATKEGRDWIIEILYVFTCFIFFGDKRKSKQDIFAAYE
jgi:hypothetical protein